VQASHDSVKGHWDREDVESMYDKRLLEAEIRLIAQHIPAGARVLDAGCGEAEGTAVYAQTPGVVVDAADFSDVRLAKAAERLGSAPNVTLHRVDFLGDYALEPGYDVVVSQRFLINLLEWDVQRRVLEDLTGLLSPGGRLVLLEGSVQGTEELNRFRSLLALPPIPIQWHNLFFDDELLVEFMATLGQRLLAADGLGAYFSLTRGVRPFFDTTLNWDSDFNARAATPEVAELLDLRGRCSRLKLWVFGS
jgi:SAM-dependent methyltransferase